MRPALMSVVLTLLAAMPVAAADLAPEMAAPTLSARVLELGAWLDRLRTALNWTPGEREVVPGEQPPKIGPVIEPDGGNGGS